MTDFNSLGGVSRILEQITGQLAKIESSQKNITNGIPRMFGALGGGTTSGTAGGGSTGNTGSAGGLGIPQGTFASGVPSGGSTSPVPLLASGRGVAALTVAGAAWAVAPDPATVMTNATRVYNAGLGYSNFNAGQARNDWRQAMTGGIRSATDVSTAASILNAYGVGPTQNLMTQSLGDVATLNRTMNFSTETSAGIVGTMSSGRWTGNAYRYGMQMSDSKGNPLSMDQQFNTLYNRFWGGRNPTREGVQNMFRAGGLQYQLSSLGMDSDMQSAFMKFALNKAGGGDPSMSALGGNDLNKNPLASTFKAGESEAKKMDSATEAVINGMETAASIIKQINDIYAELPAQARAMVEYTKSAHSGFASNPMMSSLGGVVSAGAGAFAASRFLSRGAGGLGSLGSTAAIAGSSLTGRLGSSLAARGIGMGAARVAGGAAGGILSGVEGYGDEQSGEGVWGGFFRNAGIGAAAGGALGAFGGGIGAVPGALIGGLIGGGGYLLGRFFGHDWDTSRDPGAGLGAGGDASSGDPGFTSGPSDSSGMFDEITALTTFSVQPRASNIPTTVMGWVTQANTSSTIGDTTITTDPGTSSGGGGKSGKTDLDKRTNARSISRGQWTTVGRVSTSKGQEYTLSGQVNVNLKSCTGGRPKWVKTRWVRDGWGPEQDASAGGDKTGLNTAVVPQGLALLQQNVPEHSIRGGGPVLMQIQVEGKGKCTVTLSVAKSIGWGKSKGGSDGASSSDGASPSGTTGTTSSKADALADWFEDHLGESRNPLTGDGFGRHCLKNVSFAARHVGIKFKRGLDTADDAGDLVAEKGKMNKGTNAPRGALLWWNESVGGGAGHVAVADGKGNALNNWGGATNERTPISRMTGKGYVGWSYANALASYGQGTWSVGSNQTANIHAGEMILPAALAEQVRTSVREAQAGQGGGGRNIKVDLHIHNATDAEALRFAKKVKTLIEEDSVTMLMGSK